jgi:hypothetical protein
MSSSGANLRPSSYHVNPHTKVYSSTAGLRARVSSNHSVDLHLLAADYLTFAHWTRLWVMARFPGLDETQVVLSSLNLTVLVAYLEAFPQNVLMSQTLDREGSVDFFPVTPLNVTAIFSNPSTQWIDLDVRISGVTRLVPKERVVVPTLTIIVLGIGLALPWAIMKARKSERR